MIFQMTYYIIFLFRFSFTLWLILISEACQLIAIREHWTFTDL